MGWEDAELYGDLDVVHRIYECALDENQWPQLLARLSRKFNSTGSALLTRNRLTGAVRIVAADAPSPNRQRALETSDASLLPASFFTTNEFAAGKVCTDRVHDDDGARQRRKPDTDSVPPLAAEHFMVLALRRDPIEDTILLLRRGRHRGHYDDGSIRRLQFLGTHLSNAAQLLARLRAANHQAANLSAFLDRLGITGFVTDGTATIRHMTAAAEQLLSSGRIFTAVGDRLRARAHGLDNDLKEAIRNCSSGIDGAEGAWRILPVQPPRGHHPVPTVFVFATIWADAIGNRLPAALVVVNDPHGHHRNSTFELARLVGLTPAESQVVALLCDGRSLVDYAASAGISVETARTLLKRAQEKTHTHSQSELVSLLLRSNSLAAPLAPARDRPPAGITRTLAKSL